MKPDYKNWVPKGMIWGLFAGFVVCCILFIVFGASGVLAKGTLKTILFIVFLAATVFFGIMTVWMYKMHQANLSGGDCCRDEIIRKWR